MDRNLNIPESLLCQPARKFFCLVGVSVNKKDIFQFVFLDDKFTIASWMYALSFSIMPQRSRVAGVQ